MSGNFMYYRGVTFAPGDTQAIVRALLDDPIEVYQFSRATLETITGILAWRQYDVAIEAFTLMCEVLRQVNPNVRISVPEKITHDNEQ